MFTTFPGIAWNLLIEKKYDEVKSLITSQNVNEEINNWSISEMLCLHGPDDPYLLKHCLDLGASFIRRYNAMINHAFNANKDNVLRFIINQAGDKIGLRYDLEGVIPTMHVFLYHMGVPVKGDPKDQTNCIKEMIHRKNTFRSVSIVLLGLRKVSSKVIGENNNDVLRMIARCFWGLKLIRND